MEKCNPKCAYSKEGHESGKRPIMVSMSEKGKFKFGEKHEMCPECMMAQSQSYEYELFGKFDILKKKW